MFQKVKNNISRAVRNDKEKALALCVRAKAATSGEMYVDTGVKVLLACVIGMLLLVSFYALFKTNIIPSVTKQITDMFSYTA